MFKTGDTILIASLMAIAVLFYIWNSISAKMDNKQLNAIITQKGVLIMQINLSELNNPEYINLNGEYNQVILAEKGRIRFLESDCPNQTCVKTGWLTQAGDKAVCIPAQTIIRIEGENQQIDNLAY
jgi:Uncharacterized protein conserved in bacteria